MEFKFIILVLSLSSLFSLYVEGRSVEGSAFVAAPDSNSHISHVPTSSPSSYQGPIPPTIQRICEVTEFPELCINTMMPLVTPNTRTDALSILHLGLTALNTETQKAIQHTKNLLNDSKTTPELEDSLNICLESFEGVIESNNKALAVVPSKYMTELEGPIDGTVTLIHDCNDAFTELATNEITLQIINEALTEMAKNNVAISNLLNDKH